MHGDVLYSPMKSASHSFSFSLFLTVSSNLIFLIFTYFIYSKQSDQLSNALNEIEILQSQITHTLKNCQQPSSTLSTIQENLSTQKTFSDLSKQLTEIQIALASKKFQLDTPDAPLNDIIQSNSHISETLQELSEIMQAKFTESDTFESFSKTPSFITESSTRPHETFTASFPNDEDLKLVFNKMTQTYPPYETIQELRNNLLYANNTPEEVSIKASFVPDEPMCKFQTYPGEMDTMISMALQNDKWYAEDITTALIQHFNPEKPNVFELGTNIGVVFVPTAMFLQSRGGEMVGVDASPENFALATVNRELNGLTNTIIVNRAILNNTAETSVVNILVNQGNRGDTRLIGTDENYNPDKRVPVRLDIATARVDDFYNANPAWFCKVDVWKLDIQGFEGQAFISASKWLSHCPPCYIVWEKADGMMNAAGTSLEEAVSFLGENGYVNFHDGLPYDTSMKIGNQKDIESFHHTCVDRFHSEILEVDV